MELQGVQKGRQFQQQLQLYDLDTAASGHGGYCCETGVDFATLLALLAGML